MKTCKLPVYVVWDILLGIDRNYEALSWWNRYAVGHAE